MASRGVATWRRATLLLLLLLASTAHSSSFFNNFFSGGIPGSPAGGSGDGGDSREYYDTLGVKQSASAAQVRKAYRKLALKHHPDKGGSPEKFKEINEAFSVLSDPERRKLYDRFGKAAVSGAAAGGAPSADMGGMGATAEDLFNMFFRGPPASRQDAGEDTVLPLEVPLEDLYTGRERKLRVQRSVACSACDGTGGKGGYAGDRCATCDGRGVVVRVAQLGPGMLQQVRMPCPDCGGTGTVLKESDRCPECKGKKIVADSAKVSVMVEPGMTSGDTIVIEGKGNQEPGLKAGDLVFLVRQKAHPVFDRLGRDNSHLLRSLTISLREALAGFERPLARLDGTSLRVAVPRGRVTRHGSVKRVPGEGMPIRGSPGLHGDLFVRVRVDLPSPKQLGEGRLRDLERILAEAEAEAAPGAEGAQQKGRETAEAAPGADGAQQQRRETHGSDGSAGEEEGAFARELEDVELDDEEEVRGGLPRASRI